MISFRLLCLAVLLLGGCTTTGRKLTQNELRQIKPGKTTLNKLTATIGEPTIYQEAQQMGQLPSACGAKGAPVKHLMYTFAAGNIASGTKSESRSFYLNKNDVVCHVALTKMHAPIW